jgi:hypothetical protein
MSAYKTRIPKEGGLIVPDVPSETPLAKPCVQCGLPWALHPFSEDKKEYICTEYVMQKAKSWNRDD